MVGTTGFEPATSPTPRVRDTRLRYVPTDSNAKWALLLYQAITSSKVSASEILVEAEEETETPIRPRPRGARRGPREVG